MRCILVHVVSLSLMFTACASNPLSNLQQEPHPDKIFIIFSEGMSVSLHDRGIRTGYRMWTVPDLQEMKTKIHVDSLEVCPSKIELKAGQVYSLKNLRVIARNADGHIVEHAPSSLPILNTFFAMTIVTEDGRKLNLRLSRSSTGLRRQI